MPDKTWWAAALVITSTREVRFRIGLNAWQSFVFKFEIRFRVLKKSSLTTFY